MDYTTKTIVRFKDIGSDLRMFIPPLSFRCMPEQWEEVEGGWEGWEG